jgi:hypothetical protein
MAAFLPEDRHCRLFPFVILFLVRRNLPVPAFSHVFDLETHDSRGEAILWTTRRRTETSRESLRCAV